MNDEILGRKQKRKPYSLSQVSRTQSTSLILRRTGSEPHRASGYASDDGITSGHVSESTIDSNVFQSPAVSLPISPLFNFDQNRLSSRFMSSTSTDTDSPLTPSSSKPLVEAEKKFCGKVMEHAKEKAGEVQEPIELDQPIKKVALELSEGQTMPFANTFGQQRSVKPKGNVKVDDIFEIAEINAHHEASQKCLNVEARERYRCKHGNRVLITGQAGIGKSTITRLIVQKIINKEMLPDMRFIFCIRCRDIDFNEKLDLFDFLLKYGVSDELDFSLEEKKFIIKSIDQSSRVVIFFDGMDEAQTEDLSQPDVTKCCVQDVVMPSVIVRSLMNSNLLPRAKVLVTSRPRQAYRFSPEYRPGAVIQILGLNEDSQKKLGKQICLSNFSSTYNVIRKDEGLENSCYVSVFCVILYAVINQSTKDHKRTPSLKLSSITRVMVYLLDKYIRSAHMKYVALDELKKIAELARKCFTQRRMIFDPNIINEVGLTQAALQAFTVTFLDSGCKLRYRIFEQEEKCSFSHLIWQEFFTAVDLMLFAPSDVFDRCLNCITSDDDYHRWEIVTKFMYGLTNTETLKHIRSHLLSNTPSTQTLWKERKDILWTSSVWSVNRQTQDSTRLVQVCNWIHETDDVLFTERIVSKFPETLKLSGNVSDLVLLHQDVRSILRLLYATFEYSKEPRKIKNIDFDSVNFTRDSFRNFASNISSTSARLQEIRLNNCDLGKSPGNQIIRFMNKAERLHISYCNLTKDDLLVIKENYGKISDPKPEVWVFLEGAVPCDVGDEWRRRNREREVSF